MGLVEISSKILAILALMLPRVMTALSIVPFFGSGSPSGMVRRGVIVASVLILVPVFLPIFPNTTFSPPLLAALVLKEAFIGMLFGFACGVGFWAMQAAGEFIDLQRGATAGSFFNPFLGGVNSPLGDLILRFAMMLFFSVGGLIIFFSALLQSFEIYPPWELLPTLNIKKAGLILKLPGQLFELSLLYASPILILFLLIDLGLGFMSRFVPSLNVFFFSFPIKSVVGTFFLILYLTFLAWAFFRGLFTSESLLFWVRSILS